MRARIIIALLITALALGACGRKSALEPPPGAPDKKEDAKKRK